MAEELKMLFFEAPRTSMDWFKGTFEPESPISNRKVYGFRQDSPFNQSIEHSSYEHS